MKIDSYILLKDIRFFAHHGVNPQETIIGNEFSISLRLQTDILNAMQSDDVSDTINYADVYETVKTEMEQPSKLLEHVSGRIINALLKRYPRIKSIDLKIYKRNPPMGADIDAAGIEIHIQRSGNEENSLRLCK